MRFTFILLLMPILVHFDAAAQKQQNSTKPEQVFTYVEQMPEFPGGNNKALAYLSANVRYPDSAIAHSIEGRVTVKFLISKNGQVDSAVVLRGIGYGCDEEAVRVVMSMPRWTPGKINGKPEKVHYTLPITFRLEDDKPADSTAHQ